MSKQVKDAVLNRKRIMVLYAGGQTRTVEPFCIGFEKDTKAPMVRVFQVSGYARKCGEILNRILLETDVWKSKGWRRWVLIHFVDAGANINFLCRINKGYFSIRIIFVSHGANTI